MALIVGTCQRGVDGRAVVHLREGDVLRQVDPRRLEVAGYVVIGLHVGLRAVPLRVLLSFDARTPAGGDVVLIGAVSTLTELTLQSGHHEEALYTY